MSADCTPGHMRRWWTWSWRRGLVGGGGSGRVWIIPYSVPPLLLQHQCLPVPCCFDAQPLRGRTEEDQTVGRASWTGWTGWTDLQDHLTTTAILPVQEKQASERRAAEISVCTSSSDIFRTEAAAKMVPINCEYCQTHTYTHSIISAF